MKHLKKFKNVIEIIEHPEVNIFADTRLLKYERDQDIKEGIAGVVPICGQCTTF